MNIKIKTSILLAVSMTFLVPVLYFGGVFPVHTSTFTYLPLYSQAELMEGSDFIVEGVLIVNSTHVEWEQSGSVVVPRIYTDWTLKAVDIIKGGPLDTIVFRVDGGKYNNIVEEDFESEVRLDQGDHILAYISKSDMDSMYEGAYYITGIDNGVFIIDANDTARNDYRNKTMGLDDLKRELRQLAGT